jgi:L-fuculose-phosphate aldolase
VTNELRLQMIDICRKMNAAGINQGTSGNLSFRTGDSFLVTPTSLSYDRMEPEDIVEMDLTAATMAGVSRPLNGASIGIF